MIQSLNADALDESGKRKPRDMLDGVEEEEVRIGLLRFTLESVE